MDKEKTAASICDSLFSVQHTDIHLEHALHTGAEGGIIGQHGIFVKQCTRVVEGSLHKVAVLALIGQAEMKATALANTALGLSPQEVTGTTL
jgi:hypothetical protein